MIRTKEAKTGAHGFEDAPGGGLLETGALPAIEKENHAEKRSRVQEESHAGTGGGDDQSAEGGTHSARDVEADRIESDGRGVIFAADDVGSERLPCGVVHDRAKSEDEGEEQQDPRRDVAEQGEDTEQAGGGDHPGLRDQEEAAAVRHVGECAGGKNY